MVACLKSGHDVGPTEGNPGSLLLFARIHLADNEDPQKGKCCPYKPLPSLELPRRVWGQSRIPTLELRSAATSQKATDQNCQPSVLKRQPPWNVRPS